MRCRRVFHISYSAAFVRGVLLFGFAMLHAGCSAHLPPCPRIITAMPADTRSMMVVRVPVRHSEQEDEFYDEGGLKAVDELHGLLASNGGDGVAWSLWARDDADWVGVAMRNRIADRGVENLNIAGCGMVAFRLSPSPLPPDEAFPALSTVVGQVRGVNICFVERSPDYNGSVESPSPGAYFAVVDQRLFIASLDRVDVEECVTRSLGTAPHLPRPLRNIARSIPGEATAYMLRTPYKEEHGVVNLVRLPHEPFRPREVSVCFIPGSDLEYRVAVPASDASPLAEYGASFVKSADDRPSAMTSEVFSSPGFQVNRLRVNIERARELRTNDGMVLVMGMGWWYGLSMIGMTEDDYVKMVDRECEREEEHEPTP